jgi:hypothetical protein
MQRMALPERLHLHAPESVSRSFRAKDGGGRIQNFSRARASKKFQPIHRSVACHLSTSCGTHGGSCPAPHPAAPQLSAAGEAPKYPARARAGPTPAWSQRVSDGTRVAGAGVAGKLLSLPRQLGGRETPAANGLVAGARSRWQAGPAPAPPSWRGGATDGGVHVMAGPARQLG